VGHHDPAIFVARPEDHGHKIGQASFPRRFPLRRRGVFFARSAVSTASAISKLLGTVLICRLHGPVDGPHFPQNLRDLHSGLD